MADYLVIDPPVSLSAANRVAIEASDRVVLVMEREPFGGVAGGLGAL